MSYSKIHVQTPPAPRQTHFQSVKAFHEEIQIPLRRSLPGNTCCNKPQLCSIPNVALHGSDILNRQAIRETLTKEIMELSGIVQNGSDAPPPKKKIRKGFCVTRLKLETFFMTPTPLPNTNPIDCRDTRILDQYHSSSPFAFPCIQKSESTFLENQELYSRRSSKTHFVLVSDMELYPRCNDPGCF